MTEDKIDQIEMERVRKPRFDLAVFLAIIITATGLLTIAALVTDHLRISVWWVK